MRVPQNIPLCKEINTIELSSYGSTDIPYIDDDQVPIYHEFGTIQIDSVEGIWVTANKSYKNYEVPSSYLVPKGYKPQLRVVVNGSNYATFKSAGLGFIFIAKWLGGSNNGLWIVDIVKE